MRAFNIMILCLCFFSSDGVVQAQSHPAFSEMQCLNKDEDPKKTFFLDRLDELKEDNLFVQSWQSDLSRNKDNGKEALTGIMFSEGQVCDGCSNSEPSINLRSGGQITQIVDYVKKKMRQETPKIELACVRGSIANKKADTPQVMCRGDTRQGTISKNAKKACTNDAMVSYIHWSVNKAIDCLSDPTDPIDPNIIFQKINNESTFRPSYASKGGKGLLQMTTIAKAAMLGASPYDSKTTLERSAGRKFLAEVLHKNAKTRPHCSLYKSFFDYDKEYEYDQKQKTASEIRWKVGQGEAPFQTNAYSNNVCDDLSLGSGMQKNILSGIGLYLFYRESRATPWLKKVLSDNGTGEGASLELKNFKEVRDYITLSIFGPGGPSQGLKYLTTGRAEIRKAISSTEYSGIKKKKGFLPPAVIRATAKGLSGAESFLSYLNATENSRETVSEFLPKDSEGNIKCSTKLSF